MSKSHTEKVIFTENKSQVYFDEVAFCLGGLQKSSFISLPFDISLNNIWHNICNNNTMTIEQKIKAILQDPKRASILEEVVNNLHKDFKYPIGKEVEFNLFINTDKPNFRKGVIVAHNFVRGTYTIEYINGWGGKSYRYCREVAIKE